MFSATTHKSIRNSLPTLKFLHYQWIFDSNCYFRSSASSPFLVLAHQKVAITCWYKGVFFVSSHRFLVATGIDKKKFQRAINIDLTLLLDCTLYASLHLKQLLSTLLLLCCHAMHKFFS